MKLFEIPVYALSKEALVHRVEKVRQKVRIDGADSCASEESIKRAIDLETFPQRLWEYNHIIGFIVISKKGDDIILDWYSPEPIFQRYYWRSTKKHFLQNAQLSGYHFYLGNLKTGEQLRKLLKKLITDFEKKLQLNNRYYYADLESFNNIDRFFDYERVLSNK